MALGIPDYHDIVRHPTDLGTIRARLAHGAAQVCTSSTLVSGYSARAPVTTSRSGSDLAQMFTGWEAKGFWEPQEPAGVTVSHTSLLARQIDGLKGE